MSNTNSAEPNIKKSRSGLNSGLDVLQCLAAQREPLSLTQISEAIGMAKSSVSQLLTTLQDRGFVRRHSDQRYVIGIGAWEIGCRAGHVELAHLALPHMAQLSRDISEGVALAVLEVNHTVCIGLVESPNAVRVHSRIGDRTPTHAASSGLALLATYSDEDVARLLPEVLERLTPLTIARRSDLLTELSKVRQRGYAVWRGGWRADVAGLAFTLRKPDQRAVAVLNVALPLGRMTEDWLDQNMPKIRAAAQAIELAFATQALPIACGTPRSRGIRKSKELASIDDF